MNKKELTEADIRTKFINPAVCPSAARYARAPARRIDLLTVAPGHSVVCQHSFSGRESCRFTD